MKTISAEQARQLQARFKKVEHLIEEIAVVIEKTALEGRDTCLIELAEHYKEVADHYIGQGFKCAVSERLTTNNKHRIIIEWCL